VSIGRNGRDQGAFSGKVKAKGPDRWAAELSLRKNFRDEGIHHASLLSDGRKVVVTGGGERQPEGLLKAPEIALLLRHSCLTSLLPLAPLVEPTLFGSDDRLRQNVGDAIKSGGKDKVGGRDALILEYTLKIEGNAFEGKEFALKLWLDATTKLPLQRTMELEGTVWLETFTTFLVDAELPDGDFKFQSEARLARARAEQLAESARLFGAYTGRNLRSLDELLTRPPALEAEIFWPPGGFVLGGVLPRDPWERPYELRVEADSTRLVSLGADGKPGGTRDDADISIEIAPSDRRAIGAVSERLNRQYAARLQLQLIGAALRAYKESYGELPADAATLARKPDWAEVWPEGGWLPGGLLPEDPWGDRFVLTGSTTLARVQVKNPKGRYTPPKGLLPDERKKLEEAARPRFSDEDRKELDRIFTESADDDLETREKARARLLRWGSSVLPLLAERIDREKDPEARTWLSRIRDAGPALPPPYLAQLGALSTFVSLDAGTRGFGSQNERNAATSLKTISSAEADFRANDRDWNHVNDFWVGDVAGLYTMHDANGQPMKLIELAVAAADAAPLKAGAAAGHYSVITDFAVPAPKAGYYFRAMTSDNSSGTPEPYPENTGGTPDMGKVHNNSRFGFCAYPAEYGVTGTRTYIISENNTIFWSDTQGEPALEWPSDAQLHAEWHRFD
jgi:hypothetical protein